MLAKYARAVRPGGGGTAPARAPLWPASAGAAGVAGPRHPTSARGRVVMRAGGPAPRRLAGSGGAREGGAQARAAAAGGRTRWGASAMRKMLTRRPRSSCGLRESCLWVPPFIGGLCARAHVLACACVCAHARLPAAEQNSACAARAARAARCVPCARGACSRALMPFAWIQHQHALSRAIAARPVPDAGR